MMTGKSRRAAWLLAAPLLGVGLALSGCQQNAGTSTTTPTVTTGSPVTAGATAPIQFTSDFDAAIATAGQEDKIVMLDVYTDWCPPCKQLDEEVFSDQNVAAEVNKDFVALKVNPEKGRANREFVERYQVQGYPTILFLNGKGEEIHRMAGFKAAEGFLEELETARSKANASA